MNGEKDKVGTVVSMSLKTVSENDNISKTKRLIAQRAKCLDEKYIFKKGDIVKWKQGLNNKNYPDYGQPILVREIFETPLTYNNTGEANVYERRDIVIGVFDEDEIFWEFFADSRRFEPFDN